jgi:TetR/AcrR family transcriptional regulator
VSGKATGSRRRRDSARSREAILDAAETVFARDGFDGSSLIAIGALAGVSPTLPAYFFGDKRGLYDAVVERLFADRDRALDPVCAAATEGLEPAEDRNGDALRDALETLVGGYLDFLRARPAFVQIMARDALDHGRRATTPRHSLAFQRGVSEVLQTLSGPPGPALDPEHLLLTTVALCFFPLEHDATMLAGLGYSAFDDDFIDARKRHVVDVLERVLRPV